MTDNLHRFFFQDWASALWFACFTSWQVNSDVVFYSRKRDGTMEPVKVNQRHVGRMILTKAIGSMERRDVTDNYKFPEGQWIEHSAQQLWINEYIDPAYSVKTAVLYNLVFNDWILHW